MYRGNRWYKCDFHLHTIASMCFEDRSVTPEQFIEKVASENLDCIAVTDHNCSTGIDEIRRLAKDKKIIVFPGVEVTCSDAKIHLLILFDLECSKEKIEDFLIKIKIDREEFGTKDAHSEFGISEIAKKAQEANAVIIPAHIDDYSGITHVSDIKRKQFLKMSNVKAVQMVKDELIITNIKDINTTEFKTKIIEKYEDVTQTNVSQYIACTKNVKELNKGIMTFSDNPNSSDSSKHGLWGIGRKYTWIKMDEHPNLESLRQALLMPDKRIKNCIESPYNPYKEPDFWITKISIDALETISEKVQLEFSPQLNTIIGGRGSGKSTIVRLLTGIFGEKGIAGLEEVQKEFKSFFQLRNEKALGRGVLKKETIIEVEVKRNGIRYKIIASDFTSNSHKLLIKKFNTDSLEFEEVDNMSLLDFFEVDIYNQKQIYEMAKNTNVLRDKIDSGIVSIYDSNQKKEELKARYIKSFLTLQESKRKIQNKSKICLEIKDINEKIDIYNKSNMSKVLSQYRCFNDEGNVINSFLHSIESEFSNFKLVFNKLKIDTPIVNNIRDEYKSELSDFIDDRNVEIQLVIKKIGELIDVTINSKEVFNKEIEKTMWGQYKKENDVKYGKNLKELELSGVDVELINSLVTNLNLKKIELDKLEKLEIGIETEEKELRELKQEYLSKNKEIRDLRTSYINKLLEYTNVKFELVPLRDKSDFESKLRSILQKESKFDEDFNNICKEIYNGEAEINLKLLIEDFRSIRLEKNTKWIYTAKFKTIIKQLNDEQIANLDFLLPEDELRVTYRPNGSKKYKLLANASAGQRTSAILAFILTEGKAPLILDQPEDDLDNKLIYELIVERLKETKENRQMIVVTHNANIPVNGDSEMIIAMNSTSNKVKINIVGTLENVEIKQEICDIMEGGDVAFKLRAEKYGFM